MPIEFECTSCSKRVRVPDGSEGRKCKCPSCQELLVVPEAEVESVEIKLEVPCPRCEHILVCDPALEGTRGLCPNCKYIFTIGPPGSNTREPIEDTTSSTFAFQCPHCMQLFEGKNGMEGRKGKCIHCQEVFEIKRQIVPAAMDSPKATDNKKPAQPKSSPEPKQKAAPKPAEPRPNLPVESRNAPAKSSQQSEDFPTIVPVLSQPSNLDWLTSIPAPQTNLNPYAESLNPYTPSVTSTSSSYSLSETAGGDVVQLRKALLSHESAIKGFALLYAISSGFSTVCAIAIACLTAYACAAGADVAVAAMLFVYAFAYLIGAGLAALVAHGLYRLNDVGKIGGAIFGVMSLCGVPFGTAFGAYLLYLIFSAKGNVVFSQRYRTAVKQTPQIRAYIPIFVWILIGLFALIFIAGALIAISGMRKGGA